MKNQKLMLGMELNIKLFFLFLALVPVVIIVFTIFYPFKLISKPLNLMALSADFEERMQAEEFLLKPFPGTEKKILWTDSSKEKTSLGFVFIHGWSASRQELSPTIEKVAEELKANLFMTRLSGHGLGSEGLQNTTTEKLLLDAEEAFQIGKKIGKKTVLVGVSTGASLALYLANKYAKTNQIEALILISPNFRPYKAESLLLRGPFGPLLGRLLIGPYYEFKPRNGEQKKYWTIRYPTRALTEMMNLVDGVKRINLNQITVPTLMIYTESDQTISIDIAKKKFKEIGSEKKLLKAVPTSSHVLAGIIMSPETTDLVIEEIKKFLH